MYAPKRYFITVKSDGAALYGTLDAGENVPAAVVFGCERGSIKLPLYRILAESVAAAAAAEQQ